MDINSRASQADICASPKRNAADSSSKEKKILQGRRQQRHSTEIGSEYHRWWVVRSALGFETNEHIAGLLLDGFHGLLQHLVVMCGGEMYQSSINTELKLPAESNDCCEEVAQSPSSSSSASPPGGIENMVEFMEYRNAISHYCDSLWRMCCQQGSQLQQLDKTSQPVQEFLIRLMGYLRAAKGKSFSLNPKKKRFKSNNICVRHQGEGNLFQVNLPKLCPLVTHQASQPSDASPNSKPTIGQSMAESATDDQQGPVDASTFPLEPEKTVIKHTEESHEKISNTIVEDCDKPENSAIEKCPNSDQGSYSYVPIQQQSEKKEQIDVQPKISQLYYTHSQPALGHEYEAQEALLNHQVLEQPSPQDQRAVEAQPLNLALHSSYPVISQQQPLQRQLPTQHFQNGSLLQNIQISNATCYQQKDLAAKDNKQHTPRSISQETNLENNKTCNSTEKKKLGQWWSSDTTLNPVASFQRDAGFNGSLRDCTFNMCENISDTAGTCDKSDGEFGFLLTDPLKILPCIDEEISDLPPLQDTETDNCSFKNYVSQSDLKINSGLALTYGKLVQGQPANSLMSVSSEQLASCVVGTGRAQSLLANTQAPSQKVKETQTVGTSTNLCSELKLNVNNTRHISEGKSHVLVGNASFQAVQPAVFSGFEKSSSVSLGTPVILYPASTFPTNDSSLASLSSLVHNIVYNSYGTTIKPLSLTPLSSISMSCNPPLFPPSSVATLDSISQKKSIAAALPVLSSHLSSARPTIVPFYISHTADSNLLKITNPPGLSRSISQPWMHTASTTTDTTATFASICGQSLSQNTTAATHHLQPSFSFANRQSTNSNNNNTSSAQVKTTGGLSWPSTEFPSTCQIRNETTLSPTLTPNLAKVEDRDKKKTKSDFPVQYLCNTPLLNQVNKADKQHDLYTRLSSNPNTQPAVVVPNVCGQLEQSITSSGTKEKPCSVLYSENAAANSRIVEACYEQEASFSVPPGTILNSLLANKYVNCREKNFVGSQKNKNVDDETDVALKTDDIIDSQTDSSIDKISSLQEGSQQDSGIKSTTKKKRRVKDAASTSKSKQAAESSSQKSSQRRQMMCPVCDIVFFSCMDLLVHRLEQHGHVCRECDSRFLTLSRLQQHKDTDHPLMLICSHCQFHTFKRNDLMEHVWLVHGANMNEADSSKDETHNCDVADSSFTHNLCDPVDTEVVQQASNKDSSMKVLESPINSCSDKQGQVSNKHDSLVKSTECNDAVYHQDYVDSCPVFVAANEHQNTSKLSLPESAFLKDLVVTDTEQASCGPVFPSFSKEVNEITRSDLGTMSAMFAQVSEYCQLDSADFLNVSDNPASESEEPRLVIDTEVPCGKDVTRIGRERDREKVTAKSKKIRPASLAHHPKRKDKPGNRGFCKSKRTPLTSYGRSNFQISDQDNASANSEKKNIQSKLSEICKKEEEEEVMDTTSGKGKERERLIMSISLKRQNSTSIYESHSRRRRKRHNSKSIVDSSTDTNVIEVANAENSYPHKSYLSTYHTSHYDAAESTSCDQISSSSDNLDKRARHGITLVDAPRSGSVLRCRDNIKPSCQPPSPAEPLKSYLRKDAIDCPKSLHIQPSILGDIVKDGCNNSYSERALSLRERHIMFSLPPKKRKLKKSLRARDVSSTLDLESEVGNTFQTHDSDIGHLKQQKAVSRPEVHLPKQADQTNKTKYDVIEGSKEEYCCKGETHENLLTLGPGDNVESNPQESGPLFAEHSQQSKVSGGSFVGGCKSQLFHRWNMKEHLRRSQSRTPEINCSVSGCEVKCLNKRDLRQHITIEHLGKTRKYMCSWPDCSKGFFARTHLSIHMLTHTGEKPVACNVCDYRCRQRTALIWHLRKHGVFHKTVKVKTRRNSTTL